jgi:hypothetical protein
MSLPTPQVVPFRTDLAHYFGALNREWIERYFVVEEADLIVFNDPLTAIVEPGGQIFFVTVGDEVFGTCAVIRCNSKLYELAKMAVSPVARGRGYGISSLKGRSTLRAQREPRLSCCCRTLVCSQLCDFTRSMVFVPYLLAPHTTTRAWMCKWSLAWTGAPKADRSEQTNFKSPVIPTTE